MLPRPPSSPLFPYTTLFRPRLASLLGPPRGGSPPRHPPGIGGRGTGSGRDRKSTRLNSSHTVISYAVFCLKKKKLDLPQDHDGSHLHYHLGRDLLVANQSHT